MPCIICKKEAKGAEESREYSCGTCTVKITGLDNEGRRHLVDQFYLNENIPAAEFLEAIFFGEHRSRGLMKLKRRTP